MKRAGGPKSTAPSPLKGSVALRLQVHRRIFAAAVDLELEVEAVALVERRDARALDGRNMDERVGLAVIALDEAEALHRVEKFDDAFAVADDLGRHRAATAAAKAAAATAAAAETSAATAAIAAASAAVAVAAATTAAAAESPSPAAVAAALLKSDL